MHRYPRALLAPPALLALLVVSLAPAAARGDNVPNFQPNFIDRIAASQYRPYEGKRLLKDLRAKGIQVWADEDEYLVVTGSPFPPKRTEFKVDVDTRGEDAGGKVSVTFFDNPDRKSDDATERKTPPTKDMQARTYDINLPSRLKKSDITKVFLSGRLEITVPYGDVKIRRGRNR